MERCLRLLQRLACLVCALVAWAPIRGAHANPALPEDFTVEGRLFDTAGNPINTNVDFKLEVVDDAGTCVLYRESRTGIDLSATDPNVQGVFSLRLGAGTKEYGTLAFTQMFSPAAATGEGGCTAVPVSATAHRKVRVMIRLSSGAGSFETLRPDTNITSTPLAKVAENALTLEGHPSADFIQVNGTSALNQTNSEYAFSLTNWPRLKALLDGTSAQYTSSTPTAAVNMNNQRVNNVADPTSPQDAATKHYVDTNVAGQAVDTSAVGPMQGGGSTLLWDQTAGKWVAGAISTAPTGAAGGDLSGTYPNPTIKNDAITANKISSTGVAINRLLITDSTVGTNIGYGTCPTVGEVYAWTTLGWACSTVTSLAPVTSVAGKSGAVTLNAGDVGGLGTAALKDWGTAASQVPLLDSAARLPAVDGSQLTNVNATSLQSRAIASTAPAAGQVLGWNSASVQWQPISIGATGVTQVFSGAGLLGGPITSTGTLSVDVGTAPAKIVQENPFAQIAQANGSTSRPSYAFGADVTTGMYSPAVGQLAWSTAGTTALTITQNQFVGIGTSAPVVPVHINLGGTVPASNFVSNTMDGLVVSRTVGAGDYVNAYLIGGTGSSGSSTLYFGNRDTLQNGSVGSAHGSDLSIRTNGAYRMRINETGNVGVGTLYPAAALDISVTGSASGILLPRDTTTNRPAGVNGMLRYNTTNNLFEGYLNGNWSNLLTASAANAIATGTGLLGGPITNGGTLSVDVGTAPSKIVQENASAQIAQANGSVSAPAYAFGASPSTGVFSPAANRVSLATNGTSRLSIDDAGVIGIGAFTTLSSTNFGYYNYDQLVVRAAEVNTNASLAIAPSGTAAISALTLLNNSSDNYSNFGYAQVVGTDMQVGTLGSSMNFYLRSNGTNRVAISPGGAIGIGSPSGANVTAPASGISLNLPTTFNSTVIQKVDTTQNSSPLDLSAVNIVQAGTGVTCGTSSPQLNGLQSGGSYTVIITDTGTAACGFNGSGLTYKFLPPNDVRLGGSSTAIYNILVVGTTAYVTWVSGF